MSFRTDFTEVGFKLNFQRELNTLSDYDWVYAENIFETGDIDKIQNFLSSRFNQPEGMHHLMIKMINSCIAKGNNR